MALRMKRRVLDVDEHETLFWLQVSETEAKAFVRGCVDSRVRIELAKLLLLIQGRQPVVPLGSAR